MSRDIQRFRSSNDPWRWVWLLHQRFRVASLLRRRQVGAPWRPRFERLWPRQRRARTSGWRRCMGVGRLAGSRNYWFLDTQIVLAQWFPRDLLDTNLVSDVLTPSRSMEDATTPRRRPRSAAMHPAPTQVSPRQRYSSCCSLRGAAGAPSDSSCWMRATCRRAWAMASGVESNACFSCAS